MKKTLLIASLSLAILSGHATALSITTTTDAQLLTETLVGTNVMVDYSTINYIGVGNQAAIFSGGFVAGLGVDQGIMLTTGNALSALGPNSQTMTSTKLNTAGDATLSNLVSGLETFDANSLEFEFTTSTGDLFFDFVFASEEYNEYLSYSDPFALFIDDVNYAIAPDGQEVSVGSVNCGDNGLDNSGPNCSSFNNNLDANGNVASFYNIEYDGFTDKFQASIMGLSAGTHHMRFVIADATDDEYDSAVFIAANSFSGGEEKTAQVPEPATLSLFGLSLLGLRVFAKKRHH